MKMENLYNSDQMIWNLSTKIGDDDSGLVFDSQQLGWTRVNLINFHA